MPRLPGERDLPGSRVPSTPRAIANYSGQGVARGVQGLASGINSLAGSLGQMERFQEGEVQVDQRNNEQREKFETNRKFLEFQAAQEQALADTKQTVQPGAFGLREKVFENYKKGASEFFKNVPEHLKPTYDQKLFIGEDRLVTDAFNYEKKARRTYYGDKVNEGLELLEKNLFDNPKAITENFEEGKAFITSIPDEDLSPIEKQAMVKAWKDRARLAAISGMDPEEALRVVGRPLVGSNGDAASMAINLIKRKEGWIRTAKYDVDAWRVGYGSDTITRADGSVIKVKKGMTTTRADSDRDLKRRRKEKENVAIGNVGVDAWAALPANARAALISVTYNYGRIPKRIRGAIKGGNVNEIAAAVNSLGGDDKGVNRKRRAEEAAIISGSATIPQSTETTSGTPDPEYADMPLDQILKVEKSAIGQIQDRISQEISEAAANASQRKIAVAQQLDGLQRGIELGTVTKKEILGADLIDGGQQATLLKALDQKRTTSEKNLAKFQSGDYIKAAGDKGTQNISDSVYEELKQGTMADLGLAKEILRRTDNVPRQVGAMIGESLSSPNSGQFFTGVQMAKELMAVDPHVFAGKSKGIKEGVQRFNAYLQNGYSEEEAARKAAGFNDPEQVAVRDTLMKSKAVKKFIEKEATIQNVGDMFDSGIFGTNPEVGASPRQTGAVVQDLKEVLEESIYETGGDLKAAWDLTVIRFKDLYSVSNTNIHGKNVLMRDAPELRYPPIKDMNGNPSHEYITDSLKANMKEMKIPATDIRLVSTLDTQKAIREGSKTPPYKIVYKTPKGLWEEHENPFFLTGEEIQGIQAKERGERIKGIEERDAAYDATSGAQQDVDAVARKAYKETEGPDWVKAKAADAAREKAIMENEDIDIPPLDLGTTPGALLGIGAKMTRDLLKGDASKPDPRFEKMKRDADARGDARKFGSPIDDSKPLVKLKSGGVGTENSTTILVTENGVEKWVNIATVVDGKELPESEAVRLYHAGSNPSLGTFDTQKEAISVAKARSKEIGRRRKSEIERFLKSEQGKKK